MKVIWKAVLGMVNCWVGVAVDFHNTLHCFRSGRGMGTTPTKVNMIQQLKAMRDEFL